MEEYLIEARTYSNTRLTNMISQSNNFNNQAVAAAKIVAVERGLVTENGAENLSSRSDLLNEAKRMLERKIPVEQVLKNLVDSGVGEKEAENAIFQASKTANLNRETLEEIEKKESSGGWWWYILIGLFVVRMILRAMKNS